MIKINDEIKLIGATELRTEIPKLTKDLQLKTVIITKQGKPLAVIENYALYQEKENFMDTFEDLVLGYLAKERHEKSKKSDYVPADKVKKN